MAALRGMARPVMLVLGLALVLGTVWVCLIAGAVLLLAARIGAGPALLAVAGGLGLLVVLAGAGAGLLRAARPGPGPARLPGALLRGTLAVAAVPGAARLLLVAAAGLFAVLALAALLLAARRAR